MNRPSGCQVLALALCVCTALPVAAQRLDTGARIDRLLNTSPVIDAHNDLLWELRDRYGGDLDKINLGSDTATLPHSTAAPSDLPPLMQTFRACGPAAWEGSSGRYGALEAWKLKNPARATIPMVADHMDHIRKIAGADSVGIGADLDGIMSTPDGLGGVDKYPRLFEELARRGWTDEDMTKAARGNILRVLRENEEVAKRLQARQLPSNTIFRP